MAALLPPSAPVSRLANTGKRLA